jgi:arginyl-tRNA synthetase
VITGELSAAVAAAAEAAQAAGELAGPPITSGAVLAGSWRPVPTAAGGGPGSYASTIPFLLASRSAGDPGHIAAVLAARLPGDGAAAGICRATVTGRGYLSLTVSPEALGRLAVRVSQAGPGCARSDALRRITVTAPAGTPLAAAGSWDEAWQWLAAELTGRLASAAGAEVRWTAGPTGSASAPPAAPGLTAAPGPAAVPASAAAPGLVAAPDLTAAPGPITTAVAFAGPDAIRYALSRAVPSGAGPGRRIPAIDPRAAAAQHLGNPFYAVRYAHAHAASILRWSADLGLPAADATQFQPRLLAHPREQALLDAMSWLPERVAGAARRGQPHVLAGYLEELSGTYLDWQECCSLCQPGAFPPGPDQPPRPDLPPGPDHRTGPDQQTGPEQRTGPHQAAGTGLRQARLMLTSAARTVLSTGLGLLGVAAPDRAS